MNLEPGEPENISQLFLSLAGPPVSQQQLQPQGEETQDGERCKAVLQQGEDVFSLSELVIKVSILPGPENVEEDAEQRD